MWVQSLSWEDTLEDKMETHSSILAWKIPWTEESDGLKSMGSQSQTRLSMLSILCLNDKSPRVSGWFCVQVCSVLL